MDSTRTPIIQYDLKQFLNKYFYGWKSYQDVECFQWEFPATHLSVLLTYLGNLSP